MKSDFGVGKFLIFEIVALGVMLMGLSVLGAPKGTTIREAQAIATKMTTVDGLSITVFETEDGNLWDCNCSNPKLGCEYTLVFDEQGTSSIYDDVIIEVR